MELEWSRKTGRGLAYRKDQEGALRRDRDKDLDRNIKSSLKKREPCEETAAEEARKSLKGSPAEVSP